MRLVVRQLVQRRLRDIEAAVRVVDCEDVDARPVERQRPAGAALRRVPSRDRGSAADELRRERPEGREALGEQPVCAVGAGDLRQGGPRRVVDRIVRNRHACRRGGRRQCGCGEGGDGGEETKELHAERCAVLGVL